MSNSQIKVFVAHSKGEGAEAVAKVQAAFVERFPSRPIAFTSGLDEFNKNFKKTRSWDAWTRNVIHGREYGSDRRRFDVILLTSAAVGKATAQIVQHALDAKIQVVLWVTVGAEGKSDFKKVRDINRVEGEEDWKCWARVVV